MRNNAGHGAVAIAVLIAPSIACRMIRQTNGLDGKNVVWVLWSVSVIPT